MERKNAILEFRLKKIDETRDNFLEEINHNELTSENLKRSRRNLNYIEHFFILASTFTGCISILLLSLSLVFSWKLQVLQLD